MKTKSILMMVIIIATISMILAIKHIDEQDEKINYLQIKVNKLESEAEKTFSVDEAMFIYKEGHRKGALRVTGNYLNFIKMYNPAEFETDSLYYRSVLEKSVK